MAIKQFYPEISPSLNLDFANTKTLDPRVTFTRASTASYYDGKTVAKAEENLLIRSQEFDNVAWVKTGTTVSVNTVVAPDGTTTADTLTATAANATLTQSTTAIAAQYTFSIYLKRKTGTGAIEIRSASGAWTSVAVTDSWTRFDVATTPAAGSKTSGVRITISGDELYVWAAQLEQRSSVTDYTATTTQPITNYIPVLQTAAANVPRFDHNPVTGESLGLLIEESRTNLMLNSSILTEVNLTGGTREGNKLVAPDGSVTASIFRGTGGISSTWTQSATATASKLTFSVFVKAGLPSSRTNFNFLMRNGTTGVNFTDAVFSIVTGNITGRGWSSTSVGNGWYRIAYTNSNSEIISVGDVIVCYLGASGGIVFAKSDRLGLWGIQLEAGEFPTSYIPTTTAQVTRAADNAIMIGTNFSSWYRQDEGTFVLHSRRQLLSSGGVTVSDGTNNNRIIVSGDSSNSDLGYVIVDGVQVANLLTSNHTGSYDIKALAYKINDIAYVKNGGGAVTDTDAVLPVVNRLGFTSPLGDAQNAMHVKRVAYYPKRLSNQQLQALTL